MTSIEILNTLLNTEFPQHLELSCEVYRRIYPEQMEEIDSILQKEIKKRFGRIETISIFVKTNTP